MTSHNNELYQNRIMAVRQQLDTWGVDGVLISSPSNRRWLGGFTGSNAKLLLTKDAALLATDFRYWEQAAAQAPDFTLFKHQRRAEDDAAFFTAVSATHIGIEANHVTLAEFERLQKATSHNWVSLAETVEPLRQVKTADEIATIAAAAAITDQAMAQVNTLARPGMSEQELAWILERTMRELGADEMAFAVIVASGPNAALPHHHPGERVLQAGDTLIVDMGAALHDYKSDMTRTFYLGNEPDTQFWTIYNLVLAAETAVLTHAKPGMNTKEIDALARDPITAAGHGDHFGHGLGHGVGLDIHENPFLSHLYEGKPVTVGMTVTVEPGIYIPGWGGVRIEDLCHVTDNGLESLSHCPKTPIIPC
ncbi:MAG: aminopeptidase P family protein [Anaerolineales bacterium]|nr:aminopeptidase P family protein [Anaerolineales bacterium]